MGRPSEAVIHYFTSAEAKQHPCSGHRLHTPHPLTAEWHHIVPVAWQLSTPITVTPPAPGPDPDGRGNLWDTRGAWWCPSGHRNVHYWIEDMMHSLADAGSEDPLVAWRLVPGTSKRLPEAKQALIGLQRFVEFGSLLALTKKGEWGQA